MVKPRAIPHLVSRMVERQDRDSWTPGQGTVSRPPTVPSVRPETPTDAPKMVTLADVDPTGLDDGEVLAYEAASGLFKPAAVGGGVSVARFVLPAAAGLKLGGADIEWIEKTDPDNIANAPLGAEYLININVAGIYLFQWSFAARIDYTAADGWILGTVNPTLSGSPSPGPVWLYDTSRMRSYHVRTNAAFADQYLYLEGAEVHAAVVNSSWSLTNNVNLSAGVNLANSPILGEGEGTMNTVVRLIRLGDL